MASERGRGVMLRQTNAIVQTVDAHIAFLVPYSCARVLSASPGDGRDGESCLPCRDGRDGDHTHRNTAKWLTEINIPCASYVDTWYCIALKLVSLYDAFSRQEYRPFVAERLGIHTLVLLLASQNDLSRQQAHSSISGINISINIRSRSTNGGGGIVIFSPSSWGYGTKKAPPGDIFNPLPGRLS